MPEPDPCACIAEIVSQGLVASDWPECMTTHTFVLSNPVKGRCDHGEDCPGEGKSKLACRFTFTWEVSGSCAGLGFSIFERDAESSDEWDDIGVDTTVYANHAGSMAIRPKCGKERKVVLYQLLDTLWEGVVRCNNCVALGQG